MLPRFSPLNHPAAKEIQAAIEECKACIIADRFIVNEGSIPVVAANFADIQLRRYRGLRQAMEFGDLYEFFRKQGRREFPKEFKGICVEEDPTGLLRAKRDAEYQKARKGPPTTWADALKSLLTGLDRAILVAVAERLVAAGSSQEKAAELLGVSGPSLCRMLAAVRQEGGKGLIGWSHASGGTPPRQESPRSGDTPLSAVVYPDDPKDAAAAASFERPGTPAE